MSAICPAAGAVSERWASRQHAWSSAACGLLDLALGRGDLFGARRQLGDREVGGELVDPRRGDVIGGLRLVELGLRRKASRIEVALAIERAPGVLGLRPGGGQRSLDRGDLLRPAAIEDVGELRLGLGERGLGVADRQLGVGLFDRADRLARFDQVAAAHVESDDAGDVDRRDRNVFAFDIADHRDRPAARRAASQLATKPIAQSDSSIIALPRRRRARPRDGAVSATRIAAPSRGPISLQPSRRMAIGRPTRK